jgi:hypothetical protein
MELDPKLTILYRAIAVNLCGTDGQRWTFRRENQDEHAYGSHLAAPDGEDISVSEHRSRLEIRGWYPKTDRTPEYFTINVSTAKPAGTIAKDIKRRLLPPYRAELARVREYNKNQADATAQRVAFTGELAAMLGMDADGTLYEADRHRTADCAQLHMHAGNYGLGSVTVDVTRRPDTVELSFSRLPAALAVKVLDVFAAEVFKARDEAGRQRAQEFAARVDAARAGQAL